MELKDLEVYQLARELSRDAWEIYRRMDMQTKRIIGDQFIRAIDSVGANIAEGFGRFHYLDKNKFNYNARGSLSEGLHWVDVLCERKIITSSEKSTLTKNIQRLSVKLNNLISATHRQTKK